MRVCLIGDLPRDDAPGAGLHAYHIAREVPEVTMVVTRTGPHSRGRIEALPDRVQLVDVRLPDFYLGPRIEPSWRDLPRYLLKTAVLALFLLRAGRHLLRGRFDVVHVHSASDFPLGVFARVFAGSRIVVTFHGTEIKRLLHLRGLQALYRRFTAVATCVSRDMEPDIQRILPRAPVHFIPPGVALARFARHEPKRDELITVGRLRWQKGYRELLEAMKLVLPGHPGYRLVIVGNGPILGEIEAEAARPPLLGRVEIIPVLGRDALAERLASARLFVLASLSEGWPKVILESLAAGTPVVGTRVGGVAEAIGPAGLVVEPGDAAGLARAVNDLLDDPARLTQLAELARARVRDFDWPKMVRPFADIYRGLDPKARAPLRLFV